MTAEIKCDRSRGASHLIGILFICAAAMGWAFLEWLGTWIQGTSPYQVVWTRYCAHLLVLGLIVGVRRPGRLIKTSRPFLQVFRSLLMLAMPICFVTAARRGMDVKDVWAITWMAVPVVMGFAVLILREQFLMREWLVTAAGLLGVWLTLRPPWPHSLLSICLAFGAAFSLGLYVVLTRLLRTEYTGTNLFHTAIWVFIPLSFYMPVIWQTPSLNVVTTMIAIGIVGLALLFFMDRALSYAPATVVAPFLFTECLWTAALRSLHHFSTLGRSGLVGAAMILGSSLWVVVREFRRKISVPAPRPLSGN